MITLDSTAGGFTRDELLVLRQNASECDDCGFCSNVPPFRSEIVAIIDELMYFKFGDNKRRTLDNGQI